MPANEPLPMSVHAECPQPLSFGPSELALAPSVSAASEVSAACTSSSRSVGRSFGTGGRQSTSPSPSPRENATDGLNSLESSDPTDITETECLRAQSHSVFTQEAALHHLRSSAVRSLTLLHGLSALHEAIKAADLNENQDAVRMRREVEAMMSSRVDVRNICNISPTELNALASCARHMGLLSSDRLPLVSHEAEDIACSDRLSRNSVSSESDFSLTNERSAKFQSNALLEFLSLSRDCSIPDCECGVGLELAHCVSSVHKHTGHVQHLKEHETSALEDMKQAFEAARRNAQQAGALQQEVTSLKALLKLHQSRHGNPSETVIDDSCPGCLTLQAALHDLRAVIADGHDRMNALNALLSKADTEKDALRAQLLLEAQNGEEIRRFAKRLRLQLVDNSKPSVTALNSLTKQKEQAEKLAADLQQALDASKLHSEDLKVQLEQSETKISELSAANSSLEQSRNALLLAAENGDSLRQEKESLLSELREEKATTLAVKSQLQLSTQRLEESEISKIGILSQIRKLVEQFDKVDISRSEQSIESPDNICDMVRDCIESLHSDVEALKMENKTIKNTASALTQQLQADIDSLQCQLKQSKLEIEQFSSLEFISVSSQTCSSLQNLGQLTCDVANAASQTPPSPDLSAAYCQTDGAANSHGVSVGCQYDSPVIHEVVSAAAHSESADGHGLHVEQNVLLSQLEDLQNQLVSTQEQITFANQTILNLENESQQKDQQILQLQAKEMDVKSRLADIVESYRQKEQELTTSLRRRDDELANLNTVSAQLRQQILTLSEQLQHQEQACANLQQQCHSKKAILQTVRQVATHVPQLRNDLRELKRVVFSRSAWHETAIEQEAEDFIRFKLHSAAVLARNSLSQTNAACQTDFEPHDAIRSSVTASPGSQSARSSSVGVELQYLEHSQANYTPRMMNTVDVYDDTQMVTSNNSGSASFGSLPTVQNSLAEPQFIPSQHSTNVSPSESAPPPIIQEANDKDLALVALLHTNSVPTGKQQWSGWTKVLHAHKHHECAVGMWLCQAAEEVIECHHQMDSLSKRNERLEAKNNEVLGTTRDKMIQVIEERDQALAQLQNALAACEMKLVDAQNQIKDVCKERHETSTLVFLWEHAMRWVSDCAQKELKGIACFEENFDIHDIAHVSAAFQDNLHQGERSFKITDVSSSESSRLESALSVGMQLVNGIRKAVLRAATAEAGIVTMSEASDELKRSFGAAVGGVEHRWQCKLEQISSVMRGAVASEESMRQEVHRLEQILQAERDKGLSTCQQLSQLQLELDCITNRPTCERGSQATVSIVETSTSTDNPRCAEAAAQAVPVTSSFCSNTNINNHTIAKMQAAFDEKPRIEARLTQALADRKRALKAAAGGASRAREATEALLLQKQKETSKAIQRDCTTQTAHPYNVQIHESTQTQVANSALCQLLEGPAVLSSQSSRSLEKNADTDYRLAAMSHDVRQLQQQLKQAVQRADSSNAHMLAWKKKAQSLEGALQVSTREVSSDGKGRDDLRQTISSLQRSLQIALNSSLR